MLFTIGQVTKMYDISHDTLRYYDKINLLKPSIKKENGYRYYTIREIELLEIILIAKQLEIPIKDIKAIIDKEDIKEYEKLFERHEKFLEEKIKKMIKLKNQVKNSKNIARQMDHFINNDEIELKYEQINKKIIFFNQNGNSYIGTIDKEKSLMMIINKDNKDELIIDESLIGVEIFKDETFDYDSYTDYIEKDFNGDYLVITRKGTISDIDEFIKKALNKMENKSNEHKEILIESMFSITRKNKENLYFVKIYIPKN